MYTIRRKKKIVGSAITIEDAVKAFMNEQRKGTSLEEPTKSELNDAVYAIGLVVEKYGRFQWGPVSLTKDKTH